MDILDRHLDGMERLPANRWMNLVMFAGLKKEI
jgi:hypothetical protein